MSTPRLPLTYPGFLERDSKETRISSKECGMGGLIILDDILDSAAQFILGRKGRRDEGVEIVKMHGADSLLAKDLCFPAASEVEFESAKGSFSFLEIDVYGASARADRWSR